MEPDRRGLQRAPGGDGGRAGCVGSGGGGSLSDVAPRSAFEVSFTLKDGLVATVKSVPPEGPVPACLAPALQKIVLPPKAWGRARVHLRWNG
jgi:hypothetical protein